MSTTARPRFSYSAVRTYRTRTGASRGRFAVWARLLSLVVALSFARGGLAPPCVAHDDPTHDHASHSSGASRARSHDAASDAPAHGRHGDHAETRGSGEGSGAPSETPCTCLGDCHGVPALVWMASAPPSVASYPPTPVRTCCPLDATARIPVRSPHALPFSTAPPGATA
ncbi:MAG TPA: hypothetical protein VEA99_02075 [Gemmatimonadaceae bacterium]|nr:hypothetical protein [Gemmatimonadaceae bacterium]